MGKITTGDTDRLPAKISPSRAKDFMQCPKLFYYKTILGLSTPQTAAAAKGTVAHHAFERIFDHERGGRGVEVAVNYVRAAWKMMIDPLVERDLLDRDSAEYRVREANECFRDKHEAGSRSERKLLDDAVTYRALFDDGSQAEEGFLRSCEEAVRRWYGMENPERFDPTERELYVLAQVAGVTLHGYIDRLDKVIGPDGNAKWYISDFKTGKKPSERFQQEAFFQLEIYALCVEAHMGIRPHQLRLIYVNEGSPDGVLTRNVTAEGLDRTKSKVKAVWSAMQKAARSGVWEPRKQVLCDWCHFKNICPAFNEGMEGILPEEIARREGTLEI
jgi:putative RecB family exonuclease